MGLIDKFNVDSLIVEIYDNAIQMGKAAALASASLIRKYISIKDNVRIIFAAAPSMIEFYEQLTAEHDLNWSKVTAFTQDEYLGASSTQSFSLINYIKEHFYDKVNPGCCYYINGDSIDLKKEFQRYTGLITARDNDLICVGIGNNGHIAFNEPHEADFNDTEIVKIIEIDDTCKAQQLDNFGFRSIDEVPKYGITLTIPPIMKTKNIIGIVPGKDKAKAVRDALLGPVIEKCPASVLRLHDSARLFLDKDSSKYLF